MSFHVPELMRITKHRLLGSDATYGNNGAFDFSSPEPGWRLMLICSDGLDWEHVSVHAYRGVGEKQRTPNWREMCYVKRLCWDAEDCVMQLHPPESSYVNNHPHTLHLWRPTDREIPQPPSETVGIRDEKTLDPLDPADIQRADDIFRRCNSDLKSVAAIPPSEAKP
jgi:hypothetical protein